ncbi:hypothetical protein H4219_002296 [Mycoemilia scoparia]|uniref:Phosphatidylinositol-glycan-specific phospholipase D n=1 Tax=Mycoemilia scoparia TaxID=417184 RepID=A0A9W8A5Z0_9FUNG|nr:hypothetical protein H4219_002296 [Mycoemilia scoparia]
MLWIPPLSMRWAFRGYGCFGKDDEAEAAHWTPFLEAGVKLLRKKYQKPYNEQAETLVAFLFGVASHQVSDELWHSINLQEGIMRVMANSGFDHKFSKAHDLLDVGGDFAIRHMDSLNYLHGSWTVPIADVVEIYKMLGQSPSLIAIELCMARQFYALEAVKRFGNDLFPMYASKSPILTEDLEDYILGGITSMTTQTHRCWSFLVDWLDDGDFTKKCLFDDSKAKPMNATRSSLRSGRQNVADKIIDATQGLGEISLPKTEYDEDTCLMHISINGKAESEIAHGKFQHQKQKYFTPQKNNQPKTNRYNPQNDTSEASGCETIDKQFATIRNVYTTQPYSGFGHSIAMGDFDGTGSIDLAVSAPLWTSSDNGRHGAVFVMKRVDNVYMMSQQDVLDLADLVITPPRLSLTNKNENNSRDNNEFPGFGSSLTVVDINKDGIDDLVIGSDRAMDLSDESNGKVYIHLGRRGVGLSSAPDIVIDSLSLSRKNHNGWSNIDRVKVGGQLFSEDINGDGYPDLVIGSPLNSKDRKIQVGHMFVYLSKPGIGSEDSNLRPDIVLRSPDPTPYEWFGTSIKAIPMPSKQEQLVLVGAPGREGSKSDTYTPLSGQIYAFRVINDTNVVPTFSLEGSEPLRQLGSLIYSWIDPDTSTPLTIFSSPTIADPGTTANGPAIPKDPPIPGWQAGDVRIMDQSRWLEDIKSRVGGNGAAFTKGIDEFEALTTWLHGKKSPGHFGRSLAGTPNGLWIGEPLSNKEQGRVYYWNSLINELQCFAPPEDVGQGRFGRNVLYRQNKHDLSKTVVISTPHDSRFSRLSGSIYILQT